MNIDWSSDENLVLTNPRLPREDAEWLHKIRESVKAPELSGHVFILTSGTTAQSAAGFKWVALSKKAVLAAAAGANQHLESSASDVWLHCLPDFHIGGLSIRARSALSGARVIQSELATWNPERFVAEARVTCATLCSLVPTQVHDLVQAGLRSPESLRAIVLGGGASSRDLVSRARTLGWPVLPSYGMSETSSQAATAPLRSLDGRSASFDEMEILPHLEVVADPDQRLRVRGQSLFTGYIIPARIAGGEWEGTFVDPKRDGWFVTEDFGAVSGCALTVLGRMSDRIKIGGETVHLGRLEALFEEETSRLGIATQMTLFAAPDERLESVIHSAQEMAADSEKTRVAVERYNQRVLPFERIRATRTVSAIPRTDLGKVKRAELARLLNSVKSVTSPVSAESSRSVD